MINSSSEPQLPSISGRLKLIAKIRSGVEKKNTIFGFYTFMEAAAQTPLSETRQEYKYEVSSWTYLVSMSIRNTTSEL